MKHLKVILSMAIVLFCFTSLNAQKTKVKTNKVAAETIAYKCPMKCEGDKTYSKAGKCPKCGMNLKAEAKPVAAVAVYQCPMKCEGDKTYDKPGKCPKCNMNLTKLETNKENDNHQGHNHK